MFVTALVFHNGCSQIKVLGLPYFPDYKSHPSISRTCFPCFRVYRMLKDDKEIGKGAV